MTYRSHIESWTRQHRAQLLAIWAVLGAAVVAALAFGPEFYYVRGVAAWPRSWAILFFLSLWSWAALRFIALWVWAWVVMALAPACLLIPLRYESFAWWLQPLLTASVVISALTVVAVWWRTRRRTPTP